MKVFDWLMQVTKIFFNEREDEYAFHYKKIITNPIFNPFIKQQQCNICMLFAMHDKTCYF
jgi:hypothetical protein